MRSKFKWILTLLVAFSMQFSFAQEKTITGTVSDASGLVPGANVVVKGTQRGASTNFDGTYSIKAKVGETLVFSFLGLRDASRIVGADNVISVTLQEEATEMTEVVITSVGIKKKNYAITSANQVVRSKELVQASNPNVVQSLSGKVVGLQINNVAGGVNSSNRIVLRGNRSISGDNQALIVIDNAISTSAILQQLPPDVVESINILKGAQGAALYGEQGVNGVIIVTTKKGNNQEKMTVSINSSMDFETVNFIAQRQTRYGQGWGGTHINNENGAWGAEMDGSIKTVGLLQANGQYFARPYSPIKDNIKKFFKTGTVIQNGVSLSGGSLETGYVSASINQQRTDYIVDRDQLVRNSFLFKGGKQIGNFTVEGNVNYITEKSDQTTQTLLEDLLQTGTNIPVEWFKNSGNEGAWTSYYQNPYWIKDNVRFEDRNDFVNGILALNYKFNDNINLSYTGNIRLNQSNSIAFQNAYVDKLNVGGGNHSQISSYDQSNSSSRRYYGDLVLNFDYKLSEKLGLKFNLGQNLQDNFARGTAVGGDNLIIPSLIGVASITGTPRYGVNGGTATTASRRVGLFANVDFDYNNVLFLNLTARNDWNSALNGGVTDNYFYPSAGLSFVPSNLESLKGSRVISYSKVYANYTKVGNSSLVTPYAINDLFNLAGSFPFSSTALGSITSFSHNLTPTDSKITPEFMSTFEAGAQFGFFKDRLTVEGSVYRTVTTDLITRQTASSGSGLASVLGNVGQMTTSGIDLEFGFTPIKTDNFTWTNRLGWSTNKSIVDEVSSQANEVALTTGTGTSTGEVGIFAVKGEQFPTIKGSSYKRDPSGRVIVDATTGNPVRNSEFTILGVANPKYIINYNTAIDYKGLRLAAVLDFRTGHKFSSGTKDWLSWSGHLYESAVNGRTGFIYPNSAIETSPGVYAANNGVGQPAVITGGTTYNSFLSYFQDEFANVGENSILDATALKIREISLSYALPSKMLENTKLASVRFGVNARNPFVFLARENRGYSDPEFSNTLGNGQGLSPVGRYPQTKTIGFNINVTF